MTTIVACCSKAGLAVIRALGGNGVRVVGLYFGINQIGVASKFVHKAYSCPDPTIDEDGFVDRVLALDRALDGSVLIPTDDGSLVAVSRNWDLLSRRFRLVSAPWSTVGKLIEKHHTYEIARACGVACPRMQMVDSVERSLEFARSIGFPCLLKPSVGHLFFKHSGQKMLMVHNEAELAAQLRTVAEYGGQFMLCEYIPGGDECGANYNSFALDGRPVQEFTAEKVRNKPRLIGFPTVVRSVLLPEVQELGRRMLAALKFTDFSCMEFKRDARDGRYKLMEVNARHNYSGALALACGVNFPLLSYLRAAGRPIVEMPATQRQDVYWIDEERDAKHVLGSLLQGRKSALHAFEPWRGRKTLAVFRSDDAAPLLRLFRTSISFAVRKQRGRVVQMARIGASR